MFTYAAGFPDDILLLHSSVAEASHLEDQRIVAIALGPPRLVAVDVLPSVPNLRLHIVAVARVEVSTRERVEEPILPLVRDAHRLSSTLLCGILLTLLQCQQVAR